MADAQAHDDVHFHPLGIQDSGLGDWVAGGFKSARSYLVVFFHVEFKFIDTAGFTAGRKRFHPLSPENVSQLIALIEQTDAGGDADLLVAHQSSQGEQVFLLAGDREAAMG